MWNPKYQLGASFIGDNRIVLGREENGFDKIEIYNYDEKEIQLNKEFFSELTGNSFVRNARPIVDINQKVFLWHRGFYNKNNSKKSTFMLFFSTFVHKLLTF